MSTFRELIDAFERMMAAVAFAECNDRETACWLMNHKTPSDALRVTNKTNRPLSRQPELRQPELRL